MASTNFLQALILILSNVVTKIIQKDEIAPSYSSMEKGEMPRIFWLHKLWMAITRDT